jgi:cysteine desulfurase
VNVAPVYLDHHATTPVDPRVTAVVVKMMSDVFGNPNSVDHVFGDQAAEAITCAREQVSSLVGADAEDVLFTSGSTQAIAFAVAHLIQKARGRRLRFGVTRVEHLALLEVVTAAAREGVADVVWIDVDDKARISMESLGRALSANVDVLCVMAANNEVGTLYPIDEIVSHAHAAGAVLLVDATQAAGRIPLRVHESGIDYTVMSAHKMYGPKGAGALIAPGEAFDADQSIWRRQGTPNVPGIAGFGEACRLRNREMCQDEPRIAQLRDHMESHLLSTVPDLVVNGDRANRLSNNLHISALGASNDAVVGRLRGTVAISTGAACSSGTHTPSHVLRAMGVSEDVQEGALRIGLGKFTTLGQVEVASAEIAAAIGTVRSAQGKSK